jgi:gas vesicle protein
MGLLVGLVTGAAAAVLYTVQTGRDLRQEFELMRSEVQQRDFDALGRHLEDRFKELQSGFEERISQVRDAASSAADDAAEAATEATS